MRVRLSWAVAGVLLFAGSALFSSSDVQEETGTTIVEVPVYVTDGDGNPVDGIHPEEFSVFEDGKRQEISFVQLIDTGASASNLPGASQSTPAAQAALPPNLTRRHFVLLFDLLYNSSQAVSRAREAAQKFISGQVGPEDPVSIFAISRSAGVQMYSNFTTDRRQLFAALANLGSLKPAPAFAVSAGLLDRPAVLENATNPINPAMGQSPGVSPADYTAIGASGRSKVDADAEILSTIAPVWATERRQYQAINRDYLSDLGNFARALNVLPGRKIVVIFGSGFDLHQAFLSAPAPGTPETDYEDMEAGRVQHQNYDLGQQAMALFSTSDCRLYLIDTAPMGEGDTFGSGGGGGTTDSARYARQDALKFMASESGGKAFLNMNSFERPLGDILKETRRYYLLAYSPPPTRKKGAYHEIKVDVRRSGVRVAARKGYYEPKSFAAYSPLERELQVAEIVNSEEAAEGISMDARAYVCRTELGAVAGSPGQIVVQVAVPSSEFSSGKTRQFDLYAFARLANGTIVDSLHGAPDLAGDGLRQRLQESGLNYVDRLLVPTGEYEVVALIRDLESGKVGARRLDVSVPDFGAAAPRLTTPVFVASKSGEVRINGADPKAGGTRFGELKVAYPFTVDKKELVPSAVVNLSAASPHLLFLKAYHLPFDQATGRPRGRMAVDLVDASGNVVQRLPFKPMRLSPSASDEFEIMLDIQPAPLAPGEYFLRVTYVGESDGKTAQAQTPFRIS